MTPRTASRYSSPELKTKPRARACREVERTESTCHLCGLPIDKTLDRKRHRLAFTVDELTPRSKGGSATERSNLRAAHRLCNSLRNDRALSVLVYAECRAAVTGQTTTASRDW